MAAMMALSESADSYKGMMHLVCQCMPAWMCFARQTPNNYAYAFNNKKYFNCLGDRRKKKLRKWGHYRKVDEVFKWQLYLKKKISTNFYYNKNLKIRKKKLQEVYTRKYTRRLNFYLDLSNNRKCFPRDAVVAMPIRHISICHDWEVISNVFFFFVRSY